MPKSLTRRDVLKLAAAASLLGVGSRFALKTAAQAQPSNRPNILVIVFDTLSAKHMSLYGYPRQTTPNLARFAKRATVFRRHYAGGNFTNAGTSSLLTGALPWTQRAFNLYGTVIQEFAQKNLFRVFADAGYYGVAYTHNWVVLEFLNQFRNDISFIKPMHELCLSDTAWSDRFFTKDFSAAVDIELLMNTRSTYGAGSLFLSTLGRAFQSDDWKKIAARYQELFPRGLPTNKENAVFILENVIDWIQNEIKQAPRPFIGYFHLMPPHSPYNPRREFIGRFDGDGLVEAPKPAHLLGSVWDEPAETRFRRNYDEFIAYADAEFGRLYDFLVETGTLDNTYVVFTSDHGELLERSVSGHMTPLLYEPITHIPLIISAPGQTKRVNVTTPTSAVDVLPTLAHLAGQPIPAWSEGKLLPTLGGEPDAGRSVFTVEAKSNAKQAPLTIATVSMVKDQYKLIHYMGYAYGYDDFYELYKLNEDPEEVGNLYPSDPDFAAALEDELLSKIDEVNRPYRRT